MMSERNDIDEQSKEQSGKYPQTSAITRDARRLRMLMNGTERDRNNHTNRQSSKIDSNQENSFIKHRERNSNNRHIRNSEKNTDPANDRNKKEKGSKWKITLAILIVAGSAFAFWLYAGGSNSIETIFSTKSQAAIARNPAAITDRLMENAPGKTNQDSIATA